MRFPAGAPLTFHDFLRIVELRTKIVSVSGYLIGILYALRREGSVPAVAAALLAVAVLAVDMATTGFNTFFDWWSGVDRRGHNREADKVVIHRGVPAGYALLISAALFGIAAVAGLALAAVTTWWLVPVGALSMLVGILYNAGPMPISRTPLGELFAGGFLGWVLVTLTIWVGRGELASRDLLAGIPSLAIVASILTVNNTCDMVGDRDAGRLTLSLVVGRRAAEGFIYLLGLSAFGGAASLGLLRVMPPSVAPGAVAAALLALPFYRRLHRIGFSHATKGPAMQSISRIFLLFTAGVTIPLLASTILGW